MASCKPHFVLPATLLARWFFPCIHPSFSLTLSLSCLCFRSLSIFLLFVAASACGSARVCARLLTLLGVHFMSPVSAGSTCVSWIFCSELYDVGFGLGTVEHICRRWLLRALARLQLCSTLHPACLIQPQSGAMVGTQAHLRGGVANYAGSADSIARPYCCIILTCVADCTDYELSAEEDSVVTIIPGTVLHATCYDCTHAALLDPL